MVDSFIRPRQRALTSMSPHAGNPGVIVPKRDFAQTVMVANTLVDQTGYSTLFGYGTMAPLAVFGRGITFVNHDVSDALLSVVIDQVQAGELEDDQFWNSITFRSDDANWNNFTLVKTSRSSFDNTTNADFAIWNFLDRDVPFIVGETYELTWRR